jgi:hypothetical protein
VDNFRSATTLGGAAVRFGNAKKPCTNGSSGLLC